MPVLRSYSTLAKLRQRQELGALDTSDDTKLMRKLRSASAQIETYVGRRIFQPIQGKHTFDYLGPLSCLFRGQDLLTLTSITDGSGTTIPTGAMIMLGGTGSAYTDYGPFYGVELDPTQGLFLWITTRVRAIAVTGVWGWHDDYANAWIDSGLTVSGNINSSVTSITLSGNPITGADAYGNAPAISAGNLVAIDTGANLEWCQVMATSSTGMTVSRGQNGTTAVAHLSGAVISVYQMPGDLEEIALRWAAFIYAQDSVNFSQSVIVPMGGAVVRPTIPNDILENLIPYMRRRVA